MERFINDEACCPLGESLGRSIFMVPGLCSWTRWLQQSWSMENHKRGCLSSNMFHKLQSSISSWRSFSALGSYRLTVQIWTWILPRHFNCNGRMRYFSSILGSHALTWCNGEWVNWWITAMLFFRPGGFNPMVGSSQGVKKQRNDITSPPMVLFHHPRSYPFGSFWSFCCIFVRLLPNYHLQGSVKSCTRLKHFFPRTSSRFIILDRIHAS